jgi:GntR family transcriptional regulator, rspAB operon transcriptional repressor
VQLAEFEPLTPSQLKDQAYAFIKRAITSLQFPPGASIVESHLAQRLGISKTPVRMALVRLEHEGFVETRRASGTFVSRMTFEDVYEVFEVRRALELCALDRLSTVAIERDLGDLRARIAHANKLGRQGHDEAAFDAINEFHLLLVDLAGNHRLSQTYRTLYDHVVRIGNVCGRIPGRNAESQDEHTSIVDALAAHHFDAARSALGTHLDSVLADYRQIAQSNHLLEGSGPQR